MTIGIYQITNNITNCVYVGSSKNIERRLTSHVNKLNKNKHENSKLQNDWNIYGERDFSSDIIKIVKDVKELPIEEHNIIENFKKTTRVYNYSNPLYEYIRKEDRVPLNLDKGKNKRPKNEYKLSQKYILEYLDSNHKEIVHKMKSYLKKNGFIIKSVADICFIKDIDICDKEILEDDRLGGLINKFYNKQGFIIIQTKYYYSQFKKLGFTCPKDDIVLIDNEMNKKLFFGKFLRKKQSENYKAQQEN